MRLCAQSSFPTPMHAYIMLQSLNTWGHMYIYKVLSLPWEPCIMMVLDSEMQSVTLYYWPLADGCFRNGFCNDPFCDFLKLFALRNSPLNLRFCKIWYIIHSSPEPWASKQMLCVSVGIFLQPSSIACTLLAQFPCPLCCSPSVQGCARSWFVMWIFAKWWWNQEEWMSWPWSWALLSSWQSVH